MHIIYNFSREACGCQRAENDSEDYLAALAESRTQTLGLFRRHAAARRHSSNLKWDRELKNNLKRQEKRRI